MSSLIVQVLYNVLGDSIIPLILTCKDFCKLYEQISKGTFMDRLINTLGARLVKDKIVEVTVPYNNFDISKFITLITNEIKCKIPNSHSNPLIIEGIIMKYTQTKTIKFNICITPDGFEEGTWTPKKYVNRKYTEEEKEVFRGYNLNISLLCMPINNKVDSLDEFLQKFVLQIRTDYFDTKYIHIYEYKNGECKNYYTFCPTSIRPCFGYMKTKFTLSEYKDGNNFKLEDLFEKEEHKKIVIVVKNQQDLKRYHKSFRSVCMTYKYVKSLTTVDWFLKYNKGNTILFVTKRRLPMYYDLTCDAVVFITSDISYTINGGNYVDHFKKIISSNQHYGYECTFYYGNEVDSYFNII